MCLQWCPHFMLSIEGWHLVPYSLLSFAGKYLATGLFLHVLLSLSFWCLLQRPPIEPRASCRSFIFLLVTLQHLFMPWSLLHTPEGWMVIFHTFNESLSSESCCLNALEITLCCQVNPEHPLCWFTFCKRSLGGVCCSCLSVGTCPEQWRSWAPKVAL